MPDKLTPHQRHRCMSRIRGKDTKPEILIRRGLHARGFRFRLQDRKLPGRPDIVLPKWGVVVMVNGCFWHGHKGCKYATTPKSNVEFWETKIIRNRHRDDVTVAHLEALGWEVITVWECELRGAKGTQERIDALTIEICQAGARKVQREQQRRLNRAETKKEQERMLKRHTMLEEEIRMMYPIPTKVKMESKEI